jgi:hypothetical protein
MPGKNGGLPVTRDELGSELAELEARIESRMDERLRVFEDRLTRTLVKLLAQTQTDVLDQTQEYVRDAQTEILRGLRRFSRVRTCSFADSKPMFPTSMPRPISVFRLSNTGSSK